MNLMQKLPPEAYNGEEHVNIFQDAIDIQVSDVQAARDDFKLQCSPITATWGLANYEREVGIPVDEDKPIEQRRSMYIAKLRGVGTTTTAVIKNIAKSFYAGEIDVIEHKKEFWLEIIFLGVLGIPINMSDLQAAIDEVIPAHMEPMYVTCAPTNTASLHAVGCGFNGITVTELPYIERQYTFTCALNIAVTATSIMITRLPQIT